MLSLIIPQAVSLSFKYFKPNFSYFIKQSPSDLKLGADGEMMDRGSSIDWGKYSLAMQAFEKCEEDGNEGLSWGEVSACEVNIT